MILNTKVIRVKHDESKRNQFIEEHIPFVIGKVSKITNRYICTEEDDAFVIGLEAFDEAISRFDSDKGNFLPFAEQVIRSRVTDWMRKEKRLRDRTTTIQQKEISDSSDLEYEFILRDEIFNLKKELAMFNVTFDDLVEKAPKKRKTLRKVTGIGKEASNSKSIVKKLFATRKLPMKDISDYVEVTLRIIKTHRDFIISVMVIKIKKFNLVDNFLIETEER